MLIKLKFSVQSDDALSFFSQKVKLYSSIAGISELCFYSRLCIACFLGISEALKKEKYITESLALSTTGNLY